MVRSAEWAHRREECSNYLSALTCLRTENVVYRVCMPTGASEKRNHARPPSARKSHSRPYLGLSNRSLQLSRPLLEDRIARKFRRSFTTYVCTYIFSTILIKPFSLTDSHTPWKYLLKKSFFLPLQHIRVYSTSWNVSTPLDKTVHSSDYSYWMMPFFTASFARSCNIIHSLSMRFVERCKHTSVIRLLRQISSYFMPEISKQTSIYRRVLNFSSLRRNAERGYTIPLLVLSEKCPLHQKMARRAADSRRTHSALCLTFKSPDVGKRRWLFERLKRREIFRFFFAQ